MSKRAIKLGATIYFDEQKEHDIIKKIEEMTKARKFSDFISNLIRVAFDSPESLESKEAIHARLNELANNDNIIKDRTVFFDSLNKEIFKMKSKLDEIYDMNLKLLTLASFKKQLGLESKVDGMLMAQFAMQKQLSQICKILEIDNPNSIFESDKVMDTHKKADMVLEYIIESYEEIVRELRENAMAQATIQVQAIPVSQPVGQPINPPVATTEVVTNQTESSLSVPSISAPKVAEKIEEKEEVYNKIEENTEPVEEVIEFSADNYDALVGLFGD